jgi:hypothetical protein
MNVNENDLDYLNEIKKGTQMSSSRGNFVETFLYEMPMGTPKTDFSQRIIQDIREKQDFYDTINVKNNLYKLEGRQLVYYWYEQNGNILLGAEFQKKPNALSINYIGKPNKNGPPYASDLYLDVLADRKNMEFTNNSILMSDDKLSDEGFKIWARLLKNGHHISVYNLDSPGQSFIKINTLDDLRNYYKHDDQHYKKYRYIISESFQDYLEIKSYFGVRRLRETSGTL